MRGRSEGSRPCRLSRFPTYLHRLTSTSRRHRSRPIATLIVSIPDFITAEEEDFLLRKVSSGMHLHIVRQLTSSWPRVRNRSGRRSLLVDGESARSPATQLILTPGYNTGVRALWLRSSELIRRRNDIEKWHTLTRTPSRLADDVVSCYRAQPTSELQLTIPALTLYAVLIAFSTRPQAPISRATRQYWA